MSPDPGFVPELRDDLIRRDVGLAAVVWSPDHPWPIAVDPASRVMLEVIDGAASVADLVADVREVVGLPADVAQAQVSRIIDRLDRGGLLTTSPAAPGAGPRSVFVSPTSSCMETSSCTGKVSSVNLDVDGQPIRVACASNRVARRLRRAVEGQLLAEQAPLGFMLRAPQRRQRDHVLVDRGGFTLGSARSVDGALAMVGSHLTVLHRPAQGRVRLRVRALLREGGAVLCPFPILFAPPFSEDALRSTGHEVLDRLAVDIDPATISLVVDPAPWPDLAVLEAPAGHSAGGAAPVPVRALVMSRAPGATAAPSAAELVANLAAEGIGGSRAAILDVAVAVVTTCQIEEADLFDPDGVGVALRRVSAGR